MQPGLNRTSQVQNFLIFPKVEASTIKNLRKEKKSMTLLYSLLDLPVIHRLLLHDLKQILQKLGISTR